MSLRRKILGGSTAIICGQAAGQVMAFVRNVIIARTISQEDYGIASSIALTLTAFEMISSLSVDRVIIQAEEGDDSRFQDTAHALQVLRGLGVGLCVFLSAWPCSLLFGVPDALWAFQCMALVPCILGFAHLDPKRLNRQLRFVPDVATELIPQIIIVAAAWPIAHYFRDYSVMLWLAVTQAFSSMVASHLFAERPYRWAWERDCLGKMLQFGWPLLLNGLLMYTILQGDRVIIGAAYDMKQLATYSVSFSFTFLLSMVFAKLATSILLPVLSKSQRDKERFAYFYTISVQLLFFLCVLCGIAFLILGEHLVEFIYGSAYAGVGSMIGWLAIAQMFRVLRIGPTIAAMSLGDTVTLLISNTSRACFVVLVLIFAFLHKPITWIAAVGFLGEIVALSVSIKSLKVYHGIATRLGLAPILVATLTIGGVTALAHNMNQASVRSSLLAMIIVNVVAGTIMVALFPVLRQSMRSLNPLKGWRVSRSELAFWMSWF